MGLVVTWQRRVWHQSGPIICHDSSSIIVSRYCSSSLLSTSAEHTEPAAESFRCILVYGRTEFCKSPLRSQELVGLLAQVTDYLGFFEQGGGDGLRWGRRGSLP